jgi:hypothetical protein
MSITVGSYVLTLTPSGHLGNFLPTLETSSCWTDPGIFAHETLVGDRGWSVLHM